MYRQVINDIHCPPNLGACSRDVDMAYAAPLPSQVLVISFDPLICW